MNGTDFDVVTKCPFCDGALQIVPAGEVPHVKHALPTCKPFDEANDALDFVMKCNDKLGIVRA